MKIKLLFFLYFSLSCLVVTDLDGMRKRPKLKPKNSNKQGQHNQTPVDPLEQLCIVEKHRAGII